MSDKLKQVIDKQAAQQEEDGIDHSKDIVQLVGFIIGEEII